MDDLVYMVRGATQAVCQRALDRICQLLDARLTMRPTDGTGRGWVARAVPMTKAPTDGPGPCRFQLAERGSELPSLRLLRAQLHGPPVTDLHLVEVLALRYVGYGYVEGAGGQFVGG